ncbi:MAG: hypothetical protein DVS81_02765 [Candidatus Accumulibacter meliphilus]|jgi:hypothetical protein|uniref:Chemotaxis protein n=1 Tax=Candidatus Accumulibacter meliphilus TaxID=2211374 RepID=A0A369XUT7_9PROT|nr:MAG: hypothetical protein DVS81_02765 [Candidatus Accumulibacter meliphilus]
MSTSVNIFGELNSFLASLDDLLKTSAAKNAPSIARRLGAEKQLAAALEFLADALTRLARALNRLHDPVLKADTVVASFEVLGDSLEDFADGEALKELTRMLALRNAPFQPLVDGIHTSAAYLDAALRLSDSLPDPGELKDTSERLNALGARLDELQAANTAPAPSQPTLPQSTNGGTLS